MAGHNGGSDNSVVTALSGRKEAKNIVDALSEIQLMSVAERSGTHISKDYFTWKISVEFFAVGFKSLLVGFIVCLFMIPAAVGAAYGLISMYGGVPNAFDKIFVFVLAFSVSSGSLLILLTAAKYVYGIITFQMVKTLYLGAIFSALIKGAALFSIFQIISAKVGSDTHHLKFFTSILPNNTAFKISNYEMSLAVVSLLKTVFRISSVIILLFSIVSVSLLITRWFLMKRKYNKYIGIVNYIEQGNANRQN